MRGSPPRRHSWRWLHPTAVITAMVALSAATGWTVASFATPSREPDTALVRKALKLRLPKTPIDKIDCRGLGGLCVSPSAAAP